jgi:DNA-binding YbaB/EbfC family protein
MSIFSKIKQVNEIRDKAKQLQAALAQETAEGTAGWGKIKVVINGNQQIQSVTIDPELLSDKSKLETLLRDAINDAIQKVQRVMATKLKDIGGLDLAKDLGDLQGSS